VKEKTSKLALSYSCVKEEHNLKPVIECKQR